MCLCLMYLRLPKDAISGSVTNSDESLTLVLGLSVVFAFWQCDRVPDHSMHELSRAIILQTC